MRFLSQPHRDYNHIMHNSLHLNSIAFITYTGATSVAQSNVCNYQSCLLSRVLHPHRMDHINRCTSPTHKHTQACTHTHTHAYLHIYRCYSILLSLGEEMMERVSGRKKTFGRVGCRQCRLSDSAQTYVSNTAFHVTHENRAQPRQAARSVANG